MSDPKRPDPMAEGKLAASNRGVTMSNPYPNDTVLECAPDGGQVQAAVLTVCRAW